MREAERRRGEYLRGKSRRAARLTQRTFRFSNGRGDEEEGESGGTGLDAVRDEAVSAAADTAVAPAESNQKEAASSATQARRLTAAAAARRIAGYWLLSRARSGLVESKLLPAAPKAFEAATAALQTTRAVESATLVLRALGVSAAGSAKLARVLLAAALFSAHPAHVLEDVECRRNREVLTAARTMTRSLGSGTLGAIAFAWRSWGRGYDSWRREDRDKLRSAILKDAIATEGLRDAVRRRYSDSGSEGEAELLAWERELDGKQAQLRSAMCRLAGEAAAKRLDTDLARARRVPDERVAHEMSVDLSGFLAKMRAQPVPESVWVRLVEELGASPKPNTDELFARLEKLHSMLNGMRPGSFEAVDPASVELVPSFAVSLVTRATAALKLSHAEADDANVDVWLQQASRRIAVTGNGGNFISTIVDVLRELTERVAKVHESVSIARVMSVAPIVQQYGATWERSRHEERVRAGEIQSDLPRTSAFLAAADGSSLAPGLSAVQCAQGLLRLALIRVCEAPTALSVEALPEVFCLDVERMIGFQNDMQRAALTAVLDNVARQFLASRVSQAAAAVLNLDLTRRVLQDDAARLEAIQDSTVSAVSSCMASSSRVLVGRDETFLRGMVKRVVQSGDAMFVLMHTRVSRQLQLLLLGANSAQTTPGLESVVGDLQSLQKRMDALATWAWNVHGEALLALASPMHSAGSEALPLGG